jgi:hypothetical protein
MQADRDHLAGRAAHLRAATQPLQAALDDAKAFLAAIADRVRNAADKDAPLDVSALPLPPPVLGVGSHCPPQRWRPPPPPDMQAQCRAFTLPPPPPSPSSLPRQRLDAVRDAFASALAAAAHKFAELAGVRGLHAEVKRRLEDAAAGAAQADKVAGMVRVWEQQLVGPLASQFKAVDILHGHADAGTEAEAEDGEAEEAAVARLLAAPRGPLASMLELVFAGIMQQSPFWTPDTTDPAPSAASDLRFPAGTASAAAAAAHEECLRVREQDQAQPRYSALLASARTHAPSRWTSNADAWRLVAVLTRALARCPAAADEHVRVCAGLRGLVAAQLNANMGEAVEGRRPLMMTPGAAHAAAMVLHPNVVIVAAVKVEKAVKDMPAPAPVARQPDARGGKGRRFKGQQIQL